MKRLLGILWLLSLTRPAGAHNGPPFPIIENKRAGPCIVSLWTHPDIGVGTFFAILEPVPGGSIPKDVQIEIAVQPATGRLPEVRYPAHRDDLRTLVEYKAEVNFDADEIWRVRLLLHSSSGDAELDSTVEPTPTGLGRWDLLWFGAPFLGAGFLWFQAIRRRSRRAR